MTQLFANAARAYLASVIGATDTTISITANGVAFPTAVSPDWFKAVLQDSTGIEIVYCTAHAVGSNTFTVQRGQEGTTARAFDAGSVFGLRITAADIAGKLDKAGGALTGGLQEAKVTMTANDIDLNTGNYFTKAISGATTLTVSNVPATDTAASFILDLTNGGSATITWWSEVKWAFGTAPTLTAAGRDVLGFFTHDGGTTWSGLVLGKDVK